MNARRRHRRPRLDSEAHTRLLAEIAIFDQPASAEIAETMRGLRGILAVPIEDADHHRMPASDGDSGSMQWAAPPFVPTITPPAAFMTKSAGAVGSRNEEILAAPAITLTHAWDDLRRFPIDPAMLDRNLVITANRTDPAFASFDVLRTRLVQAMAARGWRRVAVTSPTKGCGKTFTAINLAMTLSRYDNSRTILLDMDLRHPAIASTLGITNAGSIGEVLRGEISIADHLRRPGENALHIGHSLAIGLNDRSESFAAELFQQPKTTEILQQMEADFAPDVLIYDLPPALAFDDVMAFRPQFDCVLLVVGGGITTAAEVKEVHRRLGEDKPVLGVILNMSEDVEDNTY